MELTEADLAPGQAAFLTRTLSVPRPAGPPVQLPVLIHSGAEPGPLLLLLGAVHGDEYEGPLTIARLMRTLPARGCRGTVAAVPVANPLAYAAATRCTPEDGRNLARVFPGDPSGSITERLAHAITESLLRRAAFLIDIHSGGAALTAPPLCGYLISDTPAGRLAAEVCMGFGAPVVWAHRTLGPGRSVSAAQALGIPWIYTEAPGGLRGNPSAVAIFARGIRRTMVRLGMLAGRPAPHRPRFHLDGDGNVDAAPTFTRAGLFLPAVRVLQRVRAGDLIGRVVDLTGQVVEEVRAGSHGVVAFLRAQPCVQPGDTAVVLAAELP